MTITEAHVTFSHIPNDSSDYLIPKRSIRQVYNNATPGPPRHVQIYTGQQGAHSLTL